MLKKFFIFYALLLLGLYSSYGYTVNCPDPQTTSLQWGEPPPPWELNPFSNRPQGEENTRFVRANILVSGYGRGVLCVYRNSLGEYSIWWNVLTKIPARKDYYWIDTLSGFVCTQGLQECTFFVAGYV